MGAAKTSPGRSRRGRCSTTARASRSFRAKIGGILTLSVAGGGMTRGISPAAQPISSTEKVSITGFASRRRHISSACACESCGRPLWIEKPSPYV